MRKTTIQARQEEQKELIIKQLSSTPIVQIACEKVGLGRATYYRWRKEDKAFLEKTDQALSEGRSLMNDMAESQLLSAIRDKNLTAIIFWLKHHHQSYKTKIELSGEIQTQPLTQKQKDLIERALKMANLNLNNNPIKNG